MLETRVSHRCHGTGRNRHGRPTRDGVLLTQFNGDEERASHKLNGRSLDEVLNSLPK